MLHATRLVPALALGLLLTALPHAGGASGPPGPAPARAEESLSAGIARCRGLVDDEEWEKGEAAVHALLDTHRENSLVFGFVEEIEEMLRLCKFRQEHDLPDAEALFGGKVKRFDRHSRTLLIEYDGPTGALWQPDGEFSVLNVRFDGGFTLEFAGRHDEIFGAIVCFDIEQNGGYLVTSGLDSEGWKPVSAYFKKLAGREVTELDGCRPGKFDATSTSMKVTRASSRFTVKRGKGTILSARDDDYQSGYLALVGNVHGISFKGRVDKHWLRSRSGELLAGAYAEWLERNWSRQIELPSWLLDGPAETFALEPLRQFPSDRPRAKKKELNRALTLFLEDGEIDDFLTAVDELGDLPELTGLWMHGLAAVAVDAFETAEADMSALLEKEPEFKPAFVFRGMARAGLRDVEGARADFDAAERVAPQYPALWASRALLLLRERDIDGAFQSLARAASLGIKNEELEGLRRWVHRAQRGPQWTEHFEHESEHFLVMSDHGKKLCFDVATALERERKNYARGLGVVPESSDKSRVLVFSSRDGYLDYAGDLEMNLSRTSGVYIPILRELLIWVPVLRTDLEHTVRHEGFHQYLHHFAESAPLWFNEGWAENFGKTEGDERREDRVQWDVYVQDLLPVRTLLMLPQSLFMLRADLTYPQSDDLVRFLRATRDDDLKGLLAAYFQALCDGQSRLEAYESVFAPHIDAVQEGFDRYMKNGGK